MQIAQPRPGSQTLHLERVFDATPQQVWDAFTRAEAFAQWINPFGEAKVHELDARVGGKVRFTMYAPDGTPLPEETLWFVKLDPPRELVQYQDNKGRSDVFADHPMTITVRLEAVGPSTKMTLTQTGLPAAVPLDMARQGFTAASDKIARLVERKPHAKALRLERAFDATPQELWDAWVDPAQYAKWFNPAPGMDLVIHEYDVRVGGRVRFDMPQPGGNRNPQEGVFHVLAPPTHLVTGSPDKSFLLDVRIVPEGKRTRLIVEVTGVPPEYHQMATVGWGQGFDKLAKLLAK
ncbi:MAG: hypothetical protein QOE90_742 [Thermoplasmata archaeon]|jgi:uncharacterized protein YndB with AHSA1/START domain|nr:hypothetical protein [Thermoplasmata archaeon]